MRVDPPFLYDHPSKYSFVGPTEKAFNPKAATQASWSASLTRPISDGPLINSKEFNRHPDSYFVVPYGNLNYKPMSPNTKTKIKRTRLMQLFLRICELLGAVGILFCVISIKGISAATGWIIRVPPGIAISQTVYATYHLARSSKGRTPSSSASYMLFAAIIDVGLIPFLAFTALISRTEYIEPVNATGHWTTLFGSDEATIKITYSTFLISVVSGSLHLVSLIISIYLGVIFRKISSLPPDMNPLEDNLTSRHKRNKSDFCLLDNRISQATTVTAVSKCNSKAEEPLIAPSRAVPFTHTRNDSHEDIGNAPHPSSSPRVLHPEVLVDPFYDRRPAHRSSQTNIKDAFYARVPSSSSPREKIQSQHNDQSIPHNSCTKVLSVPMDQDPLEEAPEENLSRFPTKSSSVYSTSTITTIATSRPASARPRSIAPSPPDSNWITHPSTSPSPSPSPPTELRHLRNKQAYQPLSQISTFRYTPNDENPLKMNPPTPPVQHQKRRHDIEQRALAPGTGNLGQGSWGPGQGTVGIGKARAWGGMGRSETGTMGGGGRVVSRSGVEVRQNGILPSGGVRAREVSGKSMEEGRGGSGGWI